MEHHSRSAVILSSSKTLSSSWHTTCTHIHRTSLFPRHQISPFPPHRPLLQVPLYLFMLSLIIHGFTWGHIPISDAGTVNVLRIPLIFHCNQKHGIEAVDPNQSRNLSITADWAETRTVLRTGHSLQILQSPKRLRVTSRSATIAPIIMLLWHGIQ